MKIGIIGCGSMGSAFAQILKSKHTLYYLDSTAGKADALAETYGGKAVPALPKKLDICILAIKPQELSNLIIDTHCSLFVSILTGVRIETLQKKFPETPILRMMPNQAIRYGKGVTALAKHPALETKEPFIEEIFGPLGLLTWISEEQFDAVTSLTGSGPAFVYALMEAMVEAGQKMGFSKETSLELVEQMISGSIATLKASQEELSTLIEHISSPGGTTRAGLKTFQEKHVSEGVIATFLAAYTRAQELATLSS